MQSEDKFEQRDIGQAPCTSSQLDGRVREATVPTDANTGCFFSLTEEAHVLPPLPGQVASTSSGTSS